MQAALDRRDVIQSRLWLGMKLRHVELRRQTLAASRLPARRLGQHAARSEDERTDLIRIADLARSQPLNRDEKHLLREIVGGAVIAEMLHAVQPDTACETAIQLRLLRLRRAWWRRGDGSGEFAIARRQRTGVSTPMHNCDANIEICPSVVEDDKVS